VTSRQLMDLVVAPAGRVMNQDEPADVGSRGQGDRVGDRGTSVRPGGRPLAVVELGVMQ